MKKILSLLLILSCLMLSVCSLGISASAEDAYSGACGAEGSSLEWAFDAATGALTVSGTGAMADYGTEIEEQAPWYGYRDEIKSVSLPDGLTKIGSYAFRHCSKLSAITIPESVDEIGASAFGGCEKLTKVVFESTYDWYVMESAESEAMNLSEEDISNTATAATYLTDTYSGYIWSREDAPGVYGIGFLILFIIAAIVVLALLIWAILFYAAFFVLPFKILFGGRKRREEKRRQQEELEAQRKAITVLGYIGLASLAVGVISLFRRRK